MINLEVTIGVEIDEETARRVAREHIGDEAKDLNDAECALIWAEDEFSRGLGCYAKVL